MKQFFKANRGALRDICIISGVFLLASALLYGYYAFFTPDGMTTVFRNWDGPGYLVVAKTFYDVQHITRINPFWFLAPSHYAYQFPLYPVFIRLFSFIGYANSMIFVSNLFALLFSIALYFLIKTVNPKANALMVAILSIFYTPRWFIVSHVGSTEPQVLFFVTLFMLFFLQKKYFLSAVFAGLSQLTKPQGIVFFVGIAAYYGIQLVTRKKGAWTIVREFSPYLLIPLALTVVFTLYYFRFGNFFVFMENEAFPTMQLPPLKVFVSEEIYYKLMGIVSGWMELIVFNYILYFIPILILFEKKLYFFGIVALMYFIPVLTFVQTDMARFILPIMPFVFVGLSDMLSQKSVYRGLLICTLMVFLFAIGYMNHNLAPLPYQ
jgi:Gpi18-like mannosyltransferase